MAKKNSKVKESDDTKEQGGHEDVEKDKALIAKMLDEYVGKAEEMEQTEREAMHGLAKEAYEAHKEMGASEAEAYERAGQAMKLAKHMAAKETAKKEADAKEAKEKAEKEAADKKECGDEMKDKKEEAKKESQTQREKELESKLLETQGKLAALQNETKKIDVEKYVDSKLAESKQPKTITKAFREAAGEIKSKEDFDSKWALFQEGIKNSRVELDWTPFVEKAATTEDGERTTDKGLNFSDCAE